MKLELRRYLIILLLHCAFVPNLFGQEVDHWEALVLAENTWNYRLGSSEPPTNWIDLDFDDSSWNQGIGGFGYGDNDDGTTISSTTSVHFRIRFTLNDKTELAKLILLADYDDAYVAYLNGIEVARGNISGNRPPYNQFADGNHEASLYNNSYPEERAMPQFVLDDLLQNGENVLAIQAHNVNATSSDLTSNFFLVAGLTSTGTQYQATPSWFREPVSFTSSNLPIVMIDTDGRSIPDEPKVPATMGIIDNGPGNINRITDPFNDYFGNIGIEIRGSSSRSFPKKQYAVETKTAAYQDTSVSLLGLPSEEDWILYAPYTDKSLIRNLLTFKLGNDQGRYAPRTRLCEVYLNEQYVGVYMLTEKIKRDKNRVDISKLNPDENSGDDLTGGYIVKIDKFDGATEGFGWDSPIFPPNRGERQTIHFQYHYPKEDEITSAQAQYIQNYVTSFEQALNGPQFRDPRFGYRAYIDVASFIDFSIMNEITKNVDGYRLSTFMYKDQDSENGKLTLGPIWDFNLAFGNANYCAGGDRTGWAWDFNRICNGDWWLIPFWWEKLLRDPDYVRQYQQRWQELRAGSVSNESIMTYIDSVANVLEAPQQRNFARWPVLDEYIWPNNYIGGTYVNEINYLKNWITDRLSWLDISIANLQVITDLETEVQQNIDIQLFPNPNSGRFSISLPKDLSMSAEVSIIDQMGKSIHYQSIDEIHENLIDIDLPQLKRGMYLLSLSHDGTQLIRRKFIVQ